MRQAVIKKGKVITDEIPPPMMGDHEVMIKVLYSCVSTGTEKATVNKSGKSLLTKAKEKPEKVKKVLDKLLADGISETISMVKSELNIGSSTGYSISGEVISVGNKVKNFKKGDFVAAGGGTANHAEIVSVPEMLVTKVEDESMLKESSSVAIGAIAMHGVRRIDMRLGEFCVVIGTGIIGLISIQILVKSGVRVMAIDIDQKKLDLAKKYGAEQCLLAGDDAEIKSNLWSNGHGVDAVLFTAATHQSDSLGQAFRMCRKRGKVVLVGVSGMDINRADIYKKEIDFEISASYGPGRYDAEYEEKGKDYPIGYVRWTEGRNMSEYLRLLSNKTIDLNEIITGLHKIDNIKDAFSPKEGQLNLMNIVQYDHEVNQKEPSTKIQVKSAKDKINVAIIGAGGFAKNMVAPNLNKLNKYFELASVCSRTGIKAKDLAANYGAPHHTTDMDEVLSNKDIDLVIITTRHGSHGELVLKSLQAGKHVFVEKPLATTPKEVEEIQKYMQSSDGRQLLIVGFNRRFSKYAKEIKKAAESRINPMLITYRMNAGYVPYDSWIHEDQGRIVGEGCHLIDLATYLTGSKIKTISTDAITSSNNSVQESDNKTFTIKYNDGSVAVIHYFAVGSKKLSKEYMEVHFDHQSIVMDDYKSLTAYDSRAKAITTKKSEKGHLELLEEVGKYLTGRTEKAPIDLEDIFETTLATFIIAGE